MDSFLAFNYESFSLELGLRYLVNLLSTFILICLIYYRNYKRSDILLTFFAFNTIIFFIAYVLNKVEISVGSAVGLFAIFSMLRYRTESLLTKDMTYLFICLAFGLLTAISNCNALEIGSLCGFILIFTFLLESKRFNTKIQTKNIVYDNINLIIPQKNEELINDLKIRTGLKITHVTIKDIDFLKDATTITIFYTT
jgi:hypothetical protein